LHLLPEDFPMDGTSTETDKVRQYKRMLDNAERNKMHEIKQPGQELIDLSDSLDPSPEIERAKSRVEEGVMWSVKHITSN
jgi:hypothetical protein